MIMLMVAGVLCFVAFGLDTTGVINAYVGASCFIVVVITVRDQLRGWGRDVGLATKARGREVRALWSWACFRTSHPHTMPPSQCSLSYYQNRASAAVLAALSKMLPASVKVRCAAPTTSKVSLAVTHVTHALRSQVLRDGGAERQIPAADLVVGDIVHVQVGCLQGGAMGCRCGNARERRIWLRRLAIASRPTCACCGPATCVWSAPP